MVFLNILLMQHVTCNIYRLYVFVIWQSEMRGKMLLKYAALFYTSCENRQDLVFPSHFQVFAPKLSNYIVE